MKKVERGYSEVLTTYAKRLRQDQTPAEKKLWDLLRQNSINSGLKFRRQQPIGQYIADFYCSTVPCVLEIDGVSHEHKQTSDCARDAYMEEKGIRVFRFTEADVLNDVESIYATLLDRMNEMTPPLTPPSRGGELPRLILVGQIMAAHGIKGEVKIKSFTEDPLSLAEYGSLQDEQGTTTFQLKLVGVHKGALIAKLKGVSDRNAAEALAKSKTKLYVPRTQLPEPEKGRYYIEDLKGFSAVSEKGKVLATLKDVQNYGAGDIAVLVSLEGKEFMLPFKEPYVGKVNVKQRTMEIMIPQGWLSEEKSEK